MIHRSRLLVLTILVGCISLFLTEAKQLAGGVKKPYNPLKNAVFGAAHAADLDGDDERDVVLLDRGEVVLMSRPELFRTRVSSGQQAHDIAVLPQGMADGRDSVVAVTATGLDELQWNPGSGQWVLVHHLGGAWLDARKLVLGEFDGFPGHDIAALADAALDDRLVLVAHRSGTAYIPAPGFPVYARARELRALDWDGDGTDEIAAVTDDGIEIFEPDGTGIHAYPWTLTDISATVLRSGTGADWLAAVAAGPQGTDFLTVLGSAGSIGPLAIGDTDVYFLTAVDFEGDGDDDLVLADHSQSALLRLTNLSDASGAPWFDPSIAMETVPFGNPARDPALSAAGLACGDFDHDGDADVFAPAQGGGLVKSTLEFVPGNAIPEQDLKLELVALDWNASSASIELRFAAPAIAIDDLGELRRLEVFVHTAPDIDEAYLPLPYQGAQYLEVPSAGQMALFSFPVPAGYDEYSTQVFTVFWRQVVLAAAGSAVLARAPAAIATYVSEINLHHLIELAGGVEWVLGMPSQIPSTTPNGGVSSGVYTPGTS